MKIYQRYILNELSKVFTLFLASFYFLFVLIDFAANMKPLSQGGVKWFDVVIYYFFQFSQIAEIIIPVALLISIIKVATEMNGRNEMTALVAGGIPTKKVLAPFLYAALGAACLLYLNFQFITPLAASKLDTFKNVYLKGNDEINSQLGHLQLRDGSILLYGMYEPKRGAFTDAFWVLGPDEIYRMKTLFPFAKTPRGKYVDHLVRDKTGDIRKKESFENHSFPDMKFETKSLSEAVHPPQWQSIIHLMQSLPAHSFSLSPKKVNDREAKCKTILFHKLTIPLLSLLVCIAITPFCIQANRHLKIFFIYALSLFGVIAFFMAMSAAKTLGIAQVLPPLWAIFIPYLCCFTFFGIKYATI